MHNRIDIDHRHSLAISREIGERLQASLRVEPELPPSIRNWIERFRELDDQRRPSLRLWSAVPKTSRALARGLQKPPRERGLVGGDENIRISRLQKITFAEMRSAGVRGMLIYCAGAADRWPRDEAIGSSCPRKRRQRRRREDLKEHPGKEEEKQHMLPRYASRPFSIACLILIPESLPRCRVSRRRSMAR